ncbi:hypothetical protein EI16_12280 [Hydrogenovibrio marinus]|uniref:Uncharacterized protein n=2 Tax=Hydrogenovibrio marinus TaxID=28885 RepID=A0A066ZR14_HYDMR|nr:hypothetical protein EI16_12280 [Hydrogenovibrio marinus]
MILATELFSCDSNSVSLQEIWQQTVHINLGNGRESIMPLYKATRLNASSRLDLSKIGFLKENPLIRPTFAESMQLYSIYLSSSTHTEFQEKSGIEENSKTFATFLPWHISNKTCPKCQGLMAMKFCTRSDHKLRPDNTYYNNLFVCHQCGVTEHSQTGEHKWQCDCPLCLEEKAKILDKQNSIPQKNTDNGTISDEVFDSILDAIRDVKPAKGFSMENAVQTLLRQNQKLKKKISDMESRTNLIQGVLIDRLTMKESLVLSEFLEGRISEQELSTKMNIKPL